MNQLSDDKVEEIRAGVEALQQDQTRRNIERAIEGRTHGSIFTDAERAEIKTIVHEALVEFFKGYGMKGKNTIVTAGIIIGALVVILGGFKTILGWVGFTYLR